MWHVILKEQVKVNPNKGYKQLQGGELTLESVSTHRKIPESTNVIEITNFYEFKWLLLKVGEEFSKTISSLTNILTDTYKF